MKALAKSHVWGPGVDKAIEKRVMPALPANLPKMLQLMLLCTRGHGHPQHRNTFTSTSQVPSSERCSLRSPTLIRSGLKCYPCSPQLLLRRLQSFTAFSLVTASLDSWYLTTNLNSPLKSSMCLRCLMGSSTSDRLLTTNGAAERMVQTMKKALRASHDNGLPLEQKLIAFLLCYHTTPHYTPGATPSSLFIGRELSTRLDLLSPDIRVRVKEKQDAQKAYHDQHSKPQKLEPGQSVWARNFRDGSTWVPATVSDQVGLLSYLVQLRNGVVASSCGPS